MLQDHGDSLEAAVASKAIAAFAMAAKVNQLLVTRLGDDKATTNAIVRYDCCLRHLEAVKQNCHKSADLSQNRLSMWMSVASTRHELRVLVGLCCKLISFSCAGTSAQGARSK